MNKTIARMKRGLGIMFTKGKNAAKGYNKTRGKIAKALRSVSNGANKLQGRNNGWDIRDNKDWTKVDF